MKCDYCQSTEQTGERCGKCGAPLPKGDTKRLEPFFYRGYIVWDMLDYARDVYITQFWLGEKLIESIEIPRQIMREFVKEGESSLSFIYGLLEVAQGKEEVMRIEEMNSKYPASFEIRRIENEYLQTFRRQMVDK